jgi:SWIM zinc finger
MALTSGERSAISRALARGGAAAVARVRYGLYRVASASRPGTAHTVCTDRGQWRCSCAAGVAGRPACWHRAAVLIAKVEAKGGRVTGPAIPAPAAPAGPAGPLPATVTPLPRRRAA